jgi:hypothetical protein
MSDSLLLQVLAALFVLILGSYGFTWAVYASMRKLADNHIAHLQEDVATLKTVFAAHEVADNLVAKIVERLDNAGRKDEGK